MENQLIDFLTYFKIGSGPHTFLCHTYVIPRILKNGLIFRDEFPQMGGILIRSDTLLYYKIHLHFNFSQTISKPWSSLGHDNKIRHPGILHIPEIQSGSHNLKAHYQGECLHMLWVGEKSSEHRL